LIIGGLIQRGTCSQNPALRLVHLFATDSDISTFGEISCFGKYLLEAPKNATIYFCH